MAAADRVLLDSDILIDLARGDGRAVELIDGFISRGERPTISIITEMELILGARSKAEQRSVGQLIQRFAVLPISEMISVRARNLTARYARSHGLTIPDALIAATAIANRALLLTRNLRHYSFIPRLQVRLPYDRGA
jgi:predicted nucleic acid-binding protein